MYRETKVIYLNAAIGAGGRIESYRRKMMWEFPAAVAAILMIAVLAIAYGGIHAIRNRAVPQNPERAKLHPVIAVPQVMEQTEEEMGVIVSEPLFEEIPWIPGVSRVVLDPGHGGTDDGCIRENVSEKDINLEITRLLEKKLTEAGYQVILTRTEDVDMSKEERVEKANYYQADIFVSIHQNAYEGTDAEGIEIWYQGGEAFGENERLARVIHQQTLASTGAAKRILRDTSDLYVTNNTMMPACLIETGFLSGKAEREKLSDPAYQEQIAEGIARGIGYYFQPKTMYLTFDDGPSGEKTEEVLDILKGKGIKATFFVIGEYVRKYPETTRRMVAEGHTIGIHCDRHEYHKLYQSVDSYMEDFELAYQTVLEVTGVEAKLFRFPGGSVNAYNKNVNNAIAAAMTAEGYIYYDWNASLEDASQKKKTREEFIAQGVSSTLEREKIVFLAHDTVENTVTCLEELLEQFPEYRMEALTPDVKPIQF